MKNIYAISSVTCLTGAAIVALTADDFSDIGVCILLTTGAIMGIILAVDKDKEERQ